MTIGRDGDELRALQSALRDYLRLEHKADNIIDSRLSDVNAYAADIERKLRSARRRLYRLAGIDETE